MARFLFTPISAAGHMAPQSRLNELVGPTMGAELLETLAITKASVLRRGDPWS